MNGSPVAIKLLMEVKTTAASSGPRRRRPPLTATPFATPHGSSRARSCSRQFTERRKRVVRGEAERNFWRRGMTRFIPFLIISSLLGLVLIGCATSVPLPFPPEPKPEPLPLQPAHEVSGMVRNADGPVAGATVRLQTTDNATTSAADGSFVLSDLTVTQPITITAWTEGYYIGWASTIPGQDPITITLRLHHTTDNFDYEWESAEFCKKCHKKAAYPEWKADAHAQSAVNPRFLTMYEGTDVHGNQSPPTGYSSGFPEPPDPSKPYFGPGYRLDFPDRAGNCAACHAPMASDLPTTNNCGWMGCHSSVTTQMSEQVPYGVVPTDLTGPAAEGISCDFCHKIGDVLLDPETGLPEPEYPGIMSLRLFRPEGEQQLFFGPFDDVAAEVDSYLPLQQESAFCAACHYGVFGGTRVYYSFGEWLASPYSDPVTGKTCQDCHMPSVDYDRFVLLEKGGQQRDPNHIYSHLMPGAADETLLQNAVTMSATGRLQGDQVLVDVSITNDQTGHHVPTDAPMRHLILSVEARDADGNLLALQEGPTLPDWTGDYAGQPGKAYAKILEDKLTQDAPTAAYWRPVRVKEDTRIAALATDSSQYAFAAPAGGGPVTLEARLVYRRAFQQLAAWKGWDDPDIVMEEISTVISHQ